MGSARAARGLVPGCGSEMANSGSGAGAKFVSVNLNKSYGQPSHSNHPSYSGSYGQATALGKGRGGSGGGGGGMVVLSRSRASQKPVPKLSVPPPLNLPSLRKEHERFDVSGSGSGSAGGSGTGVGTRPGSSGMGWTKPVSIGSQDKNGNVVDSPGEQGGRTVDGEIRAAVAYTPPSARSSSTGVGVPGANSAKSFPQSVEKAVVLRGEDFPSLQAALPALSGLGIKHKDNLNQKQKQVSSELTDQQRDGNHFNSAVDMRPQGQASRHTVANSMVEDRNEGQGLGNLHIVNHSKKEEYFPGLLPLVRLNPRSDWADDERDTGHGFVDRSRDFGNSKSESYWDRDFDMPRASVLPHKSIHNQHERLGLRDDETGRSFSNEVFKLDPYRRDIGTPNREGRDGSAWRSSSIHRDGANAQDVSRDKNNIGTRVPNKDILKENRYIPPHSGATSQNVGTSRNQETTYGRRDMGYVQEARPQWNNRGTERITRDRYSTDQSSRHRGDSFQNVTTKLSFVSGAKMSPGTDSVLGREKHALSKTERSYLEDPFVDSAGFDERDPFTGSFFGVLKRKKDTVKQADFHDPVRESFEAELERVQQMQELERQRIIEEQEKLLEQARREEEERQRLIREEEDRRRRLEEEAREAAWRAEQERLEAVRKAEELKMAREEEKRSIILEEERRKQAAYQKLLELEAKIAKRGGDSGNTDGSVSTGTMDCNFSAMGKDKDVSSSPAELDTWEDSERMVERITASASFDRSFDITSRPYPTREGPSSFLDKGKPLNSWRRDVYENGNNVSSQPLVQDISHLSPRRDSFSNARIAPRKEFYGGPGYMSSRNPVRGVMQEPYSDEFGHQKDQRWNFPGEAESYSRTKDMEFEFQDNPSEKYSDFGWGENRFRSNTRLPFPERHYQVDEHSSYGRSRYPMRQPRVLPPPLIASTQRTSSPGTSGFLEKDNLYSHKGRIESTGQTGYYTGHQDRIEQSELVNMESDLTMADDQTPHKDMTPRCDSQSSVSVSSPPNSPPHLSHDELDESGDSPLLSTREGNQVSPSGNEEILNDNPGQRNVMTASSSISGVEDDEWTLENNTKLQEQEEYDEDEDGYQEEDEVHEGDTHNIDLNQEFDDLHLEDKSSSHMVENLVLGFDEGVEVEIPSDDFERNLSNEEDRGPGVPDSSGCIVGERLVDDVQGDEGSNGQIDGSSQPTVIQERDKAIQDSVAQSTGDDNAHSAKQAISISVGMASSSGLSPISTVSSVTSQDIPVKLQFGLFSGPSLIPSPVPAIQIGSIQMPLHLHPPVGTSLAHMHQPQPPIFQFGQLRYNTPISQGLLPVPPQSMSFVQPSVQTLNSLNQGTGNLAQSSQDSSTQSAVRDDVPSLALKNQHSVCILGPVDQSHGNPSLGFSSSVVRETIDVNVHKQISTTVLSGNGNAKRLVSESVAQTEVGEKNDAVLKHPLPLSRGRLSEQQLQNQQVTSEPLSETTFGGMKPHGPLSVSKGKRFTYAVKNSSMRSFHPSDLTGSDVNGFQRRSRRTVHRTEFRVRENGERRQPGGLVSSNTINLDEKLNNSGRSVGNFARSGSKRFTMSSKPTKQVANSEGLVTVYSGSQEINSTNQVRKEVRKDASLNENLSGPGEGNLKRNIPEEDVDAPLQSGVVRVFKQPGIEAPSDEDDFIEVRSKRQMLNDRREQREKEIKAKSRVTKLSRKPRATKPMTTGWTNSRKVTGRESSQNHRSDFASSEGRGLVYKEGSVGLLSQTLAPIGTPAVKSETQADKRSQIKPLQSNSLSVVDGAAKDNISAVMFENKTKAMDNVPIPLNSWDNARISHQVMTLTQTQLEEAMKPPRYDAPIASVGGHSSAASEPLLPSSSILSKERSFSSAANPINSLLAGERIQFGAVTSPTILPPSNRAPGSSRSEMQIPPKLSADADDCTLFFEKDKQADNSCVRLRDSEAEAEAAASAVAVAAISTDEVVVNGLGAVSISDSNNFGGADIDGIPAGMVDDQQLANQSRAEESLTVSLPADLSLETPSISLWPTISSPQSSSSQMLSHFPGGPPSHFPFYEMNPIMGGPFFAFGPHEESSGSQSQPQKSTPASSSGPLGTWQQCHSTVDSFYGPHAGFTGPFINHPGAIPGVQGPPHMVVYNHFAPVGQFGQVGLSFMGPTYIPSGKPPDWKHNAPSSAVVMGDGDLNNSSIAPAHRNLAQGSTLLPMPSPMAMFDVSPFQSAPDIPVQARWSHVPASPLHAVSLTRPHQQQVDGVVPSQFGHAHSMPRGSTLSEKGANFSLATEASASQFAEELSMVDSSRSTAAGASAQTAAGDSSSASAPAEVGKTNNLRNSGKNNSEGHNSSGFKTRSTQQSHSANYNFQRGGVMASQRNNSGSEWSHRRMGFHGRNQMFGVEKGLPSSKMKQVYVAKQSSGTTTRE